MWNEMYIWLSSPEQAAAVNGAIWLSLILSLIWMAIATIRNWRWQKRQEDRRLVAAATQARFVAFDSYVRCGGWSTDLQALAYDSMLREATEAAQKHGIEYFTEFCEQLEVAQVELDMVLAKFAEEVRKNAAVSPQNDRMGR